MTELPMHHWPTPHQLQSLHAARTLSGEWFFPEVRWTEAAAASISEDDDHLRGLVKRHCL